MTDNQLNQTPIASTVAQATDSEATKATTGATANGNATPPVNTDTTINTEENASNTPREGSALHYATLRMSPNIRQQALDALSLIQTVSSCLTGVQEAPVAQTKLQWWSDEIGRLALNEARHPATKRCAHFLSDDEVVQTHLNTLLDAATAARFDAPNDDAAWNELVQRDYASRLSVLIHATQGTMNDIDGATKAKIDVNELALSFAWINVLSTLPSRIHHDQVALPPSLYEQFNLSREQLQKHIRVEGRAAKDHDDTASVQAMLQQAIKNAIEATDSALQSQSYKQLRLDDDSKAIAIWLQLKRAQLQLWQKQQPNLLCETMTLTPLRKWYIAFRHR